MEVHHHAHTARKKWTHYFWEFIMLFLAVFCGFLAEYQLEHTIEKQREKQYIISLVEDLQTDRKSLDTTVFYFKKKEKTPDTLLMLFPGLSTGYSKKLYTNLEAIYGFPDFVKADRTMQQLKNSGGMRLIQNKKAADAITAYDMMNRDLDIDIGNLGDIFNEMRTCRFEIVNLASLEADLNVKSIAVMEASGKHYLLKTDLASLGKFNNLIGFFKSRINDVIKAVEKLNAKAGEVIAILKNEYHLD